LVHAEKAEAHSKLLQVRTKSIEARWSPDKGIRLGELQAGGEVFRTPPKSTLQEVSADSPNDNPNQSDDSLDHVASLRMKSLNVDCLKRAFARES
jgi:hypothetical protein